MAVSHSQTSDDSQSHPPGVYNLKAVNENYQKRPQCHDTDPIDDDVVLDRQPMEETQLVDDSDFDDEKRTCLGEHEDEVVLDSEDEEVNGSRIVNVRSLSSAQRCDAGLSCIDSQDPGEASEDIALNFVDQFVSLNNDLSFNSPRIDKKTAKVKSPPVRSTKGSHSLARMIDLQCQSEKARAYEWVDPEENGALRFLDKKMGSSAVDNEGKKASSVARHHKVRHIDYSSCDRGNENRFIQHPHKEMTMSEGKIENGSFNASEEQLNANITRLQLESSAIGGDAVDIFDVGFITQMAAEAMEALAYADVVNAVTDSGGDKENKMHVEHPSLEKSEFPDVGGFNKKVTQNKRSTKVSKRTGALYQKQELDPDPTALTKVITSIFFGEYSRNSADPDENLHVESPKTVKKRKLYSAADCIKNHVSTTHQTKHSMSGCRQKRIEDGCNNPGARMNGVTDYGIVTYRRKKRCLNARPAEKISGMGIGFNEPIERKSNVKKDDIITYRRKKRTGAKDRGSNSSSSLEGDSSRKTGSLKLGLWNHPKKKRTSSNRSRATVLYSPFAPVDGKDSISDCDDRLQNSNSMKGKSQSSLNSFAPWLSSNSNSERSLSELQYGKVDGTHSSSGNDCTSPSNCTTGINVGSSKAVSHDYHKRPCNKNMPKSSLLKELIGLGVPELMLDLTWKNLRRRRSITYVRVLISQHLDDGITKQQKKIIARLGLSVASSSIEATHFVADQFARTRNMLEFIALGKPVVTHMWLESCGEANCLISEKDYILRDAKKEKEIGFSMPVSLDCAKRCPLLKGQKVFITPNIKPSKDMLTNLVKTAQGKPVEKVQISAAKGKKIVDDILILSCEEDQAICLPFLEKGAYVYSSELVLNGIVIQRLEYKRHQLFTNVIKKDDS